MASNPKIDPELPADLEAVLPPDLRHAEAYQWRALSPSQRAKALLRFEALERWRYGKGDIDAADAAKLANTSVSSFYRIAANWRELASLAALGIHARPRKRESTVAIPDDVVERLSSAAREVALLFGDMSVSSHVDRMMRHASLPTGTPMPGNTKLREIAEEARRRVNAQIALGQLIGFDCCALSLPRADKRPHIGFLCMDLGRGVILGVAIGNIDAKLSGYAAASSNALRVIDKSGVDWRWSNVFSTLRMTATNKDDRLSEVIHRLNSRNRNTQFILQRDKMHGRLISKVVGPRLGLVRFTPSRTDEGVATPNNKDMTPWTEAEAYDALRRAADDYNAGVVNPDWAGALEPPPHLRAVLSELTGLLG